MNFDITVGDYRLTMVDSVVVKRSIANLADTAFVKLPGTAYNQALEIERMIGPGDPVRIRLGYDADTEKLPVEFEGYVDRIGMEEGSLRIDCEDGMRLFRRELEPAAFAGVTVGELLRHVVGQVGDFKVDCDFDFRYDRFSIYATTGFEVLKKVQEETRASIGLCGDTLHVHPQYGRVGRKVAYDLAVNVEKSELEYRDTSGRKLLVEVTGTDPQGRKVRVSRGVAGGDKTTVELPGVSDAASLTLRAEEELKIRSGEGAEGSLTGWLVPEVAPADIVDLRDADYACKNGCYYVTAVETTFSSAGGSRKITLGKKME